MVALFGGQGSQHVGMGEEIYKNFDLAREMYQEASDILQTDMVKLLHSENTQLNKSTYAQSAIFLVSMVAFEVFMQELGGSVKPLLALGHSLGEISANAASGALDLKRGLKLVFKRGERMEEICSAYKEELGMLVVLGGDAQVLGDYCKQAKQEGQLLYVANFNGPQVVLAGPKSLLQNLNSKILGAKKCVLLPMNVVSHCPILEPMVEDFRALLQESLHNNYHFGVLSNATTQVYQDKEGALECLGIQLVQPVRYSECMQVCERRSSYYVEFGTSVLKNLNKRLSAKPTYSITTLTDLKEALTFVRQEV
ncbi:ACP S-malonyltransferase [Helicobacter suis]|nr:ACP S-malonyltransferase [Helicobacter suis]BCD45576.1 Malonyl CoA-acyl carrier protein transacylase FabD [Helicobacter suis]BCD47230.1 Malonyl CoA-acyl carrier protein transacylase FabD [Helicobacter suis]BCD48985.1 Malonyl CoA-acyl carrier protein transacylase FabD [Helicobacter suis]BCD50771.1 Malonyl CoA-acyl carrier protein transacylase FabD [Helicobacter suis]BCD70102.1 Malonyl CoA-acyl carrier protein transacylase FabD [Helicobacter suis]